MTGKLLHPEYFRAPFGEGQRNDLSDEILLFSDTILSESMETPNISFLVQSVNDTGSQLERLVHDLDAQEYPAGVQLIVVHGGDMSSHAREVARHYNAVVRQVDDTRPDFRPALLQEGLEAADTDFVFTTVGHAALSNSLVLRAAVHHITQEDVGGAFGIGLPDKQASLAERAGARLLGAHMLKDGQPIRMEKGGLGMLSADSSIVRKAVAQELGYAPEYGMGGHDGHLGELMLDNGLIVVRDTMLSVHHTHGFGPLTSLKQLQMWRAMAEPHDYDPADWTWHPNGGL